MITKILSSKLYGKWSNILTEKLIEYWVNNQIKNDYEPNRFHYFKDTNKIENWGKFFDPYFKIIEQDEENNQMYPKVKTTTQTSFKYYAGEYSRLINGYLRYPTHYDNADLVQEHINIINGEFEKNILHENIVVVRKIRNHFIPKNIKIGTIITDNAFLSTSLDLNYRKNYDGDLAPLNNETLIFIKVERNTQVIYLEPISKRDEYEMLLSPNVNLLVEKKYRILNNQILFTRIV